MNITIQLHDRTISELRARWIEAHPKNKMTYLRLLNRALDFRLELMRSRDANLL